MIYLQVKFTYIRFDFIILIFNYLYKWTCYKKLDVSFEEK